MTDPSPPEPVFAPPPAKAPDDDKVMPIVVYVLFLLGWATAGLTPLIGFIMAMSLKGKAADWTRSHFVFQIRTGWMSLIGATVAVLVGLVGVVLVIVLIGFGLLWMSGAILALIGVWVSVRCIVGLIYASKGEAYPRPDAWII